VLATALFAAGCSLHDPQRTAAKAEAGTVGVPPGTAGSSDPRQRLSRDASRALRAPALSREQAPDVWTRARLGFALTEELTHPRVLVYLEHYRRHPNIITVSSARAKPFAHFILTEIERRGLPGELLLLPIVESGYAAEATSSGLAAGIWQFIPRTGDHFGLTQDDWYDGRRDVYQSTMAALDYLEGLYARFGDWYLALAAYNHGQGNVARAIGANAAAGRPTDYWHLELSGEAMAYVPRLLALRALFAEPARYGITLPNIANAVYLEPVELGRQADLDYIAELARIDAQRILQLNPGYRQRVTHPHGAQHLMLPVPAAQRLQSVLREQDAEHPLMRYIDYAVQPGDNLGQIAQRHGLRVSELQEINRLNGDLIRVGQNLRIPASARAAEAGPDPQPATQAGSPARPYTVQAGDSLWTISQRHDVSLTRLRQDNALAPDAVLQPGQVLQLARSGPARTTVAPTSVADATQRLEYEIRPGDSLSTISRRFEVAIHDVRRWNALNGDGIRAGDTLTLYVGRPAGG